MDLGLKDGAVCVQGGTKGMGRAAAECFAADGARVVVLAREQAGIDETVARLTELGSPDAWGVRIDLLDPPSIEAAFEQIRQRWSELNTLVNAAGPGATRATWDGISDEEYHRALEAAAAADEAGATDEIGDVATSFVAELESVAPATDAAFDDAEDVDASPEAVEFFLLARLAALRTVSFAGSVPLIIDDALTGKPQAEVEQLLHKLERMSESVQIIYLSDDATVTGWADNVGFEHAAVVAASPAFG